ncbi:MAG: hypothetical protein WBX81_09705 [Nitrososphaeraceae archaeon]
MPATKIPVTGADTPSSGRSLRSIKSVGLPPVQAETLFILFASTIYDIVFPSSNTVNCAAPVAFVTIGGNAD